MTDILRSLLRPAIQFFCHHKPYPFRALNDPDIRVCEKCGKNYRASRVKP